MDVTLLCQEWAVCNMLCRTIHTGGLQQCPPQREGTAVHMDDATRQRKQKLDMDSRAGLRGAHQHVVGEPDGALEQRH